MSEELEENLTHSAEQAFVDAYKKQHPELSESDIIKALRAWAQAYD